MQSKKRSVAAVVLAAAVCIGAGFGIAVGTKSAAKSKAVGYADDGDVTTRGLITNISLSTGGGDGVVWAQAKNTFTLFSATIPTYVELYYSYESGKTYTDMICADVVYTADLNMGETLELKVSTDGEQRYWQARLKYKLDNGSWTTKLTDVMLRDADGNYVP